MLDALAILVLFLSILTGVGSGLLFLLRQNGNQKANVFCGLLLLTFGICLFRPWLAHFPGGLKPFEVFFAPVWYSLALGPFLFYYVKLRLYPVYMLRWTDAKHFALPLAQALFYVVLYFQGTSEKYWLWESFVLPFFKTFEGILFVISFFSYLAIAFRYVKFKQATLARKGFEWQRQKALWLRRVLLVLFFVAGVNSFYIVLDFVLFNFFTLNLQNQSGYRFLGDVSFAAMLLWLAYKAFQNAWLGPYAFFTPSSPRAIFPYSLEGRPDGVSAVQQLDLLIEQEHIYRDPDIKTATLARMIGLSAKEQAALVLQERGISLKKWINQRRLEEAIRHLKDPRYASYSLPSIGYDSGFNSRGRFKRAFRAQMGVSLQAFIEKEAPWRN